MDERESITHKEDTPRQLIQSITAKQVTALAWIITAGLYGFIEGKWGGYNVDLGGTGPYPEYGWIFVLFGIALGVALAASVVSMGEKK